MYLAQLTYNRSACPKTRQLFRLCTRTVLAGLALATLFFVQTAFANGDGCREVYKNNSHDTDPFQPEYLTQSSREEPSTYTSNEIGQDPEIVSVMLFLAKALQHDLSISDTDFLKIKSIVAQFDPRILDPQTIHRLEYIAKELILHTVNLEHTIAKLDELGLREKLVKMGNPRKLDSASHLLNKEPLRSYPVGQGGGRTAAQLGLSIVNHGTRSREVYDAITSSPSGEPNAFISRAYAFRENANYGNGFYTAKGTDDAYNFGLKVYLILDPNAREGTDFIYVRLHQWVIILNKSAVKVVPESPN